MPPKTPNPKPGTRNTKPGTGNDLPKLAAPALRALAAVEISSLKQLSLWREEDLAELHGMGPNAIATIKKALKEKGLAFKKSK